MKGVNLILESMSTSMVNGERIEIRGFGSFSVRYRRPRNAHNPKTGEKVIAEGKNTAHFKPGKALRARVETSRHSHPICTDDHE